MQNEYVLKVFNKICKENANQAEYIQAVKEILESLELYVNNNPSIEKNNVLERFLEPDRIIEFKVTWTDDNNIIHVNKGYRVQHSTLLGPYKGGLRFHPSVNQSTMKFLAVEQCLKNSLTTLPLGGGKGGSNFDPKGKSEAEIKRFCEAFTTELAKYIGENKDVPAGDIGVSAKEIGYMFDKYIKLTNGGIGTFTGKGLSFGGVKCRKEATGFGLNYFTNKALQVLKNTTLENKEVAISGSGNVAIYAALKARELKAKVITMSDSNGYIYDKNGIDIDVVRKIKEENKGRIKEYLNYYPNATYVEHNPSMWSIKCDIAMPCAIQNELDLEDAKMLVKNKVIGVFEGANMPTTLDAMHYLIDNNVIFAPGKASNAGGVAVSGIEMEQNAQKTEYTFEYVDNRLKSIMENIFNNIYNTSKEFNIKENDLITGANIAGFKKIAEALMKE